MHYSDADETRTTELPYTAFSMSPAEREQLAELGFHEGANDSILPVYSFGLGADNAFLRAVNAAQDSMSLCTIVIRCGTEPTTSGPILVASATQSFLALEVWLGAALASLGQRQVVHLNPSGEVRGTPAGALAQLPEHTRGWKEEHTRSIQHSLRALQDLAAVIVVQAEAADLAQIVHDYPGATVISLVVGRSVTAEIAPAVMTVFESAVALRLAQLRVQHTISDSTHHTDTAGESRQRVSERTGQLLHIGSDATHTGSDAGAGALAADQTRVRASDVLFVRLTDQEVEVVNRTQLVADLVVDLGAAKADVTNRSELRLQLGPGETILTPTAEIDSLRSLRGPSGVRRTWSHSESTVFAGGDQQIHGVTVSLASPAGIELGAATFAVPNGLDRAITSRELMERFNAQSVPVLPEPRERRQAHTPDWMLLESVCSAVGAAQALL